MAILSQYMRDKENFEKQACLICNGIGQVSPGVVNEEPVIGAEICKGCLGTGYKPFEAVDVMNVLKGILRG